MFRRAFVLLLLISLCAVIFPTSAQDEPQAASFIPADFAGFIQINVDNANATLRGLNISAFVASVLQPNRVLLGDNLLLYDDFIPFNQLFDVDGTSFVNNVLPWLAGDMVIAYRSFNAELKTSADDVLLILPSDDILGSAGRLSTIIGAQDLLQRETYLGVTVYIGDKASIALTAPAVFIGPTDLVHAALDVQAGQGDALIDAAAYQAVRGVSAEESLVFAYVGGEHIIPAVSGLLSGQSDSEALLTAFGTALTQMRPSIGFDSLLLNQGFDGVAVTLGVEVLDGVSYLKTHAVFHTAQNDNVAALAKADNTLLDLIPRNALMAQSGADFSGLISDLMTALPMSNFARQMFGGLPIRTVGTDSELITAPESREVEDAVSSFVAVLEQFGDFNLQADLLDHLSGEYAFALLPRPNNPLPALNTPFDVLLVARVTDGDAAVDGLSLLANRLFGLQALDDVMLGDWTFKQLGIDSESVFTLGVKDGLLILATGDAAQSALDAERGDNRLTDQQPWQALSRAERPDLYLDAAVFYNTFFPSAGGGVPAQDNRTRFGVFTDYLGDGLYELRLDASLPTGG